MKATGVVRRIDELGRIVIPKEIRKTMRIREGENIEIYIDGNDHVVLKKYSVIKKLGDLADQITDAIYSFLKCNIVITDMDSVIAVSGPYKKELHGKSLSDDMLQVMQKRENILKKGKEKITIIDSKSYVGTYLFQTIVCNGDVVGLMILFKEDGLLGELEEKIVQITSQFLVKYLEE